MPQDTRRYCSIMVAAAFVAVVRAETTVPACRLWIAPSHLWREAQPRFGLFAGVDFRENETLPNPDIGITLVDIAASNYLGLENYDLFREIIRYLEEIVWMSAFAGAHWEGNHSSTIYTPGIGTLSNHHSGFYNIDWRQADVFLRERDGVVEEGRASPGRGAYTEFYNMSMKATQNIPAGMELFANFGDVWDDAPEDLYQDRISRADYRDAEDILTKVADFMKKHEREMKGELKQEVLDFIMDTLVETAGGKRGKVIKSLLPQTPDKVKRAVEMGGAFMYRNQDLIKTPEWLEEHGLCVDTLYSGVSTVPHAGRGAFASRKFSEGDIIAPVPLKPILTEELMDMYLIYEYEADDGSTGTTYDRNYHIGQQLLINYCLGHAESSLLLVPSSPMVSLVNHAPEPNAQLLWSAHDFVGFDHGIHDVPFLEWNLDDVDPQIVMLLVATRDIEPGEEIFLNYGPRWEEAWDEHMERFEEFLMLAGESVWPRRAADVRAEYKNKPYPTDLKQNEIPYPAGVFTACFLETDIVPDGQPNRDQDGNEILQWIGPKTRDEYTGHNLMVCDLFNREGDENNGYTYTVYTRFKDDTNVVQVIGVPHSAVILLDKPYMADAYSYGAFRHWIEIPDEMFPQAWRNLRN